MRSYTRWTIVAGVYVADWIGARFAVRAAPATASIVVTMPDGTSHELTPDESRMLAVRMIEACSLADAEAIREHADPPIVLSVANTSIERADGCYALTAAGRGLECGVHGKECRFVHDNGDYRA